jgi:fucose permease
MGLLGFLSSIGGFIGVLGGGPICARIGSRFVMIPAFALVVVSLVIIGISATTGGVVTIAACLFLLGLGSGFGGIAMNLEGAAVDRASTKSLLPSIHGAFSAGTLGGSALGAAMIALGVPVSTSFEFVCLIYLAAMGIGVVNIPRESGRRVTASMNTQEIATVPSRLQRRGVLREPRQLFVMFIIFGLVLGEAVAGTWIPLALTSNGHMAEAAASLGLTLYFAGMTLGRFTGGFVVDRLGRSRALFSYTVIAVIGIAIVSTSELTHLPYVGAVLWGIGLSVGFPLCVSAVSFDQRLAPSRVGYLASTGSVAGTVGPPVVGFVGQAAGLFAAFTIPVAFLVAGLFANKNTGLVSGEVAHHEEILDQP